MTDAIPIACSLGTIELRQRLDQIAAVGAESLIDRRSEKGRHRLRFRPDATTRDRLETIVAAEAKCCSFLDLSLEEEGEELILSIAAPQDGRAVADQLAAAFASPT
jgi:hypothetical protein